MNSLTGTTTHAGYWYAFHMLCTLCKYELPLFLNDSVSADLVYEGTFVVLYILSVAKQLCGIQ